MKVKLKMFIRKGFGEQTVSVFEIEDGHFVDVLKIRELDVFDKDANITLQIQEEEEEAD